MASVSNPLFYGPRQRFAIILFCLAMAACKPHTKIYQSDCDSEHKFIKVSFAHLLDSLPFYDHKYIETTGIYREGKEKSALYNNGDYNKPDNKALWVNFSQDCELYLKGTHIGFFEYDNGAFLKIDNKKMRIRGKIDINNRGHLKQYKGCIDRISLVEL